MTSDELIRGLNQRDPRAIGKAITLVENGDENAEAILASLDEGLVSSATILGITGPPGAGKSTLTNAIISELRKREERIGIIAIDPTSPISGGAILGASWKRGGTRDMARSAGKFRPSWAVRPWNLSSDGQPQMGMIAEINRW